MSIRTTHQPATGGSRITRAIKSGFAAVALTSAITAFGAILGAGSASAATAQPAAPAVTGVTWHQLTTINGWHSALSGSIYQPSGTSEIFAVLPKTARPKHTLYIQVMVYTPDNTAHAGTLLIEPDGAMEAYSQTSSEAQTFTSLAGLSFPLGS
ncbi:MAG TPA: hypothetical protein VFJ07_15150 [Streptosporangiaceae bacterium]|nr:hypothetical protein [Streptosporangiaceae bacterium]